MDSDEEFMRFSDSEKQSSPPIPERKLKRLRKATENVPKYPLPAPSTEDDDPPPLPPPFFEVNSNLSAFEALDSVEINGEEDLEELDAGNESPSESFKEGIELDSGLDSLDVEETRSGAKRGLEFDSVAEEFDAEVGDLTPTEVPVETKEKKKKKKRVKSSADDFDDSLYSAASTKKMRDKERRERLKNLRAESQRLLRETRDASFKPVLSVQKSVSSVLEKIRQRKHELSKKLVTTNTDSFIDDEDTVSREVTLDFDFENSPQNSPIKEVGDKVTGSYGDQTALCSVDLGAQSPQEFKQSLNESHKNETSKMALGEDSKQTFRPPVDDTQDLIFDSQTSDSKDDLSDEMPSSPLEDILGPSLLAMNLKLDSAPPDDFSSDEEDNDKENVDPCRQGSADLASSPKGDPVKAFVDDEAEEEDDSDNDLARFKDNEEDEDTMDSEEINDIIATGYEEKPVDNEMRNQLHQEWLEKQDAAGTENLLQRLKCRSKQRDIALTEEEEGEDGEEVEEGFLDDPAEYLVPKNVVRMNLKKAKEMICQMFTDKDDVYVSSDDEETEERHAKRQLSDKTEEQAKFMSPAEDAGSKEIFGLIKKLNGVPDTRRRAKITSQFHTLSIGGNKTMSSKSSFLSKRSRNSLPSLQKHGPSTVRSFVFERDDSNSRSAIPMSEDSSDVVQIENRPKKTASAKYSSSQVRSSAQNTQTTAEKTSGPSLHEILKCQSLQSSHFSGGSMSRQVEAIYASFKLDQTLVKKERGVSIRSA